MPQKRRLQISVVQHDIQYCFCGGAHHKCRGYLYFYLLAQAAERNHDLHDELGGVRPFVRVHAASQGFLFHQPALAFREHALQSVRVSVLHQHVREHAVSHVHQRGSLPRHRPPSALQDFADQAQC